MGVQCGFVMLYNNVEIGVVGSNLCQICNIGKNISNVYIVGLQYSPYLCGINI